MTGPAVVFGGPAAACMVEAHCCLCAWTSGPCRSQGEALAAHAAHQRYAHPGAGWGGGR